MIIGSHVPFLKEKQLLGSVEFALLMGENAFMFYTGAPQNTVRLEIDKKLTDTNEKCIRYAFFYIT